MSDEATKQLATQLRIIAYEERLANADVLYQAATYIERIERERDAQNILEASYRKRLVVLDERIAELEHERDEARGTIKQLSESAVLMFQEAECRFEEHREKNKRLERENEEVRRWLRIRTDSKNAAEDKVAGLEARTVELEAENARLQAIVDEQAEDEGLWFVAETAPEAYLQQELRRLHAAIDAARKP